MDPQFQTTSFIPKKAAESGAAAKAVAGIFTVIAAFVFVAALAASAGVFFYERTLQAKIAADKTSLDAAKEAFDPTLYQGIIDLSRRIESVKAILASHTAITPLFANLQSAIIRTVRMDSMTLTLSDPQKLAITFAGQANDFQSIAYQSDVMAQVALIHTPLFSNFALDPSGKVLFSFAATIDPRLVSYLRNLSPSGSVSSIPAGAPAQGANSSPSIKPSQFAPASSGTGASSGGVVRFPSSGSSQ